MRHQTLYGELLAQMGRGQIIGMGGLELRQLPAQHTMQAGESRWTGDLRP
jgi:hypothetical protein